jgi:hypothetical protein
MHQLFTRKHFARGRCALACRSIIIVVTTITVLFHLLFHLPSAAVPSIYLSIYLSIYKQHTIHKYIQKKKEREAPLAALL